MTQLVTELKCAEASQMVGVCQSLFGGSSAADIAASMAKLGITRLRVSVLAQSQVDTCKAIVAANPAVRLNLLVLAYTSNTVSWSDQRSLISQLVALGCVESIEGPNEQNLFASHGPADNLAYATPADIKTGALLWAKAIHDAFPNLLLYSPTLATCSPADFVASTPNLAGMITHAAIHKYGAPGQFMSNDDGHGSLLQEHRGFPWIVKQARDCTGVSSVVLTETGAAGAAVVENGVVDLNTQATLVLADVLDAMAMGVSRTFIYNLFDTPDPSNTGGSEAHYGLVNADLSIKPAGAAVARLLAMLQDTGSTFLPQALPAAVYSMDNTASAAGQYLAFRKSDGSDYIVVWNEPIVWANGAPVDPPPVSVLVTWGDADMRDYDAIDLVTGTAVSSSHWNSAVIPLKGRPVILHLKPIPGSIPDPIPAVVVSAVAASAAVVIPPSLTIPDLNAVSKTTAEGLAAMFTAIASKAT